MTRKKYKAIIFDLDGTLLDTLDDLCDSMNRVLEDRGYLTHELDAYRHFVGDGVAMLVEKTLPEDKRDDDTIKECVEAFREIYDQNWNVKSRPYDGIPEMLDAVFGLDLKIAVLSNKPHDFTKKCVEEFLPNWKFEIVFGIRDSVPRKPDPAGALETAKRFCISPSDFLYVGDTPVDMKTAISAGMFPLAVLWGFRSREELVENGAKALAAHPSEILDYLDLRLRKT